MLHAHQYLLWPSNFRIINPRKVFCGATWPLLTGMFTRRISSRSAFTSKIPKLQMLALGAAAFTADHRRSVRPRSLSLHFLNDLPSSLPSLCAWACEFLLAETHGVGEDCQSCDEFAQHFVSRTGAILTCSAVLYCAQEAHSGWYAKGVTWFPGGLVPSTSSEGKSQLCALKMMGIWISCPIRRGTLQGSAFIPHFQGTRASTTCTLHAFSVKYSLEFNYTIKLLPA